eukprot:2065050-Prymnesium_polylepis.1
MHPAARPAAPAATRCQRHTSSGILFASPSWMRHDVSCITRGVQCAAAPHTTHHRRALTSDHGTMDGSSSCAHDDCMYPYESFISPSLPLRIPLSLYRTVQTGPSSTIFN